MEEVDILEEKHVFFVGLKYVDLSFPVPCFQFDTLTTAKCQTLLVGISEAIF